MSITPKLLPVMIQASVHAIEQNAEEITALDQAIGDGDHVVNLTRGLKALQAQQEELGGLNDWPSAWMKIGMTLMSTVGGASGSLYGTFFVTMSKAGRDRDMDLTVFADVFKQGVESVKQRGKADAGEKTMLDVLIPVAECLARSAEDSAGLSRVLGALPAIAVAGMESTRNMLATKGRASFLGERSLGHIDAGAKTMQLMICAVVGVLCDSTSPS
ncbi:MAG: dihydroxyacetone kinase subunit DhaL [Gammaproteobacteria bacterium]